jgi:hypothetical protein
VLIVYRVNNLAHVTFFSLDIWHHIINLYLIISHVNQVSDLLLHISVAYCQVC